MPEHRGLGIARRFPLTAAYSRWWRTPRSRAPFSRAAIPACSLAETAVPDGSASAPRGICQRFGRSPSIRLIPALCSRARVRRGSGALATAAPVGETGGGYRPGMLDRDTVRDRVGGGPGRSSYHLGWRGDRRRLPQHGWRRHLGASHERHVRSGRSRHEDRVDAAQARVSQHRARHVHERRSGRHVAGTGHQRKMAAALCARHGD